MGLKLLPVESYQAVTEAAEREDVASTLASLGYNRFLDKAVEEAQLFTVLCEQDATPFTNESVAAYKQEKLNSLQANLSYKVSSVVAFVVAIISICEVLTLVGCIFAELTYPPFPFFATLGWLVVAVCITIFLGILSTHVLDRSGGNVMWEKVTLKEYQEDIPNDVALLITKIHKKLPKAEFFLDCLQKNTDPFLVVRHRKAQFVVAVWDEPDFKARKLA